MKKSFFSYAKREVACVNCHTDEEGDKIEIFFDILDFFNEATNIFFGIEYPTTNLFLSQICTIKNILNKSLILSDFLL